MIIGGSGTGKSVMLKCLIGLLTVTEGKIWYRDREITQMGEIELIDVRRDIAYVFQQAALFDSMTVFENIAYPLRAHLDLSDQEIAEKVELNLERVGLPGAADLMPAELSGGMRKRIGLARAIALDPEVLFFDEPSAGLDPVSAKNLDDLIIEINRSLGATVIIVTHELPSIFAIANNAVFLDTTTRTVGGNGDPKQMLETSDNPDVIRFLTRGEATGNSNAKDVTP